MKVLITKCTFILEVPSDSLVVACADMFGSWVASDRREGVSGAEVLPPIKPIRTLFSNSIHLKLNSP